MHNKSLIIIIFIYLSASIHPNKHRKFLINLLCQYVLLISRYLISLKNWIVMKKLWYCQTLNPNLPVCKSCNPCLCTLSCGVWKIPHMPLWSHKMYDRILIYFWLLIVFLCLISGEYCQLGIALCTLLGS